MAARAPASSPKKIAIVGAGIAGLACARTLRQAGHEVAVLDRQDTVGGRAASQESPFGSFDHGAQYFTVRDERFRRALATAPAAFKPWSATAVRVLDAHGRVAEAALPTREAHWVGAPAMGALAEAWAEPLAAAGQLQLGARVTRIEADALDPRRWQLRSEADDEGQHVHSGFDAVMLALPCATARTMLLQSGLQQHWDAALSQVQVAPCWTLMLAFPQAVEPQVSHIGPQWNAALSSHHRVAWLARESSKPGRSRIERWTVQASPAWSEEHLDDDAPRVQAKLLKAFAEITGIRAEPAHAEVMRWRHAKTRQALGMPYLWDARRGLGVCGDWCLGHRVEEAFISGLELALAAAGR